jgi:ribosomal protein S18 acetylase RimI-like enzyme
MKILNAQLEHAREIMGWFPDKESVIRWGSPYMRYPLEEQAFLEDILWGRVDSLIAVDDSGRLIGFGQFYPKLGRCHLARLVIAPDMRGRGHGEAFVAALMRHCAERLGATEFSLYVMTANRSALNCYHALGFHLATPPDGDPQLLDTVFMTCSGLPAEADEQP